MAMAGNAPVLPGTPVPVVPTLRRFELPDMTSRGQWMMERLRSNYPHMSDRQLHGWLGGLIYSPEFLFLHQAHSVALAQSVKQNVLVPNATVQEIFVFVEDPQNKLHQDEGAEFYSEFMRWGRSIGATEVEIGRLSDVPFKSIEARVGRIVRRTAMFADIPRVQ